jgi:hypothetical protein
MRRTPASLTFRARAPIDGCEASIWSARTSSPPQTQPIAEIRPLPSRRTKKRPVGLAKGKLTVPKEFFDPLPHELVQAFHGEAQ